MTDTSKHSRGMILEKIVVGPMQVNCYILGSDTTAQAIVIDPGAQPERIKQRLKDCRVKLAYIVNTHGHADHIAANTAWDVPVYIHRLDAEFLKNPQLNLSSMLGLSLTDTSSDVRVLEDGQRLRLGEINLQIMHTPGHTPGGICLSAEGICFTGDTLFAQGIGRSDIPGACEQDLLRSIKDRLLSLPDETLIYPGHGASSTIGRERENFAWNG